MFRKVFLTAALLTLIAAPTAALTDPEPNPFANLEEGERVLEVNVDNVADDILTVIDEEDEEYSGRFDQIFKYRDGGGPAAVNEFFEGDRLRIMIDANNIVRAAQNYELLLCDQNHYGWVRNPREGYFMLKTTDRQRYRVNIGETTQYRNETRELLLGYSPRENDIIRVHGVINTNTGQIFTETFGAYISLLADDALQPFYEQIETELAQQKFDDVPENHKFFQAVQFVEYEEIVSGYPDGTYQADNPINRAEFTKILMGARFLNEVPDEAATKCFPDFEKEQWFAPFVCLAKQKGVLAGYPDGTFQPSNNVNLAEALKIIITSFNIEHDSAKAGEAWYQPFVNKAEELQILPENFAEARDNLTRGQMAELVTRSIKYSRSELENYLNKSNE